MSPQVKAGFASAVITPPIGTPMSGYPDVRTDLPWTPDAMKGYVGRRRRPSEGIHDPLLVTVLALEVDGVRAVLAGLDTLVVSAEFTAGVRDALAAEGVPPANVLLGASHTHSGPDLFAWWEGDPAAAPAPMAAEHTVAAARRALERLGGGGLALWAGALSLWGGDPRAERPGGKTPRVTLSPV